MNSRWQNISGKRKILVLVLLKVSSSTWKYIFRHVWSKLIQYKSHATIWSDQQVAILSPTQGKGQQILNGNNCNCTRDQCCEKERAHHSFSWHIKNVRQWELRNLANILINLRIISFLSNFVNFKLFLPCSSCWHLVWHS